MLWRRGKLPVCCRANTERQLFTLKFMPTGLACRLCWPSQPMDLSPGPSYCEAMMLTTTPPCQPTFRKSYPNNAISFKWHGNIKVTESLSFDLVDMPVQQETFYRESNSYKIHKSTVCKFKSFILSVEEGQKYNELTQKSEMEGGKMMLSSKKTSFHFIKVLFLHFEVFCTNCNRSRKIVERWE